MQHTNSIPGGGSPSPKPSAYFSTFATNVFIQICTLSQGILLARLLGPVGRGEFASVILWPNIFAGLGLWGSNIAIARLAGKNFPESSLTKAAVKISLLTGIITLFLCWFLLPFLVPADKYHLLHLAQLFLLFIPVNHLCLNLLAIDHGYGNFKWFNLSRMVLYPVFFGGILLSAVIAENRLEGVLVSLLVANCFVAVLRIVAKMPSLFQKGRARSVAIFELLKQGSSFMVAGVVTMIFAQIDKALIVYLLSSEEIGWYMAAFAAAGSINVLNSSLGVVQFSISTQTDTGLGFATLAKAVRRGGLISGVGCVAMAFILPFLLPLVYGEDFRPAIVIAIILLPGVAAAGIGEIINQSLRGQGRPYASVVSKSLGLIVLTVLSVLLVGELGVAGICLSYLVSQVITLIGLVVFSFKFYRDVDASVLMPGREDVIFIWEKISEKITRKHG